MSTTPFFTIPRPYLDPIGSLLEVVSIACLALARPLCNDTIVLSLNAELCAVGLMRCDPLSTSVVHNIIGQVALNSEVSSVVLVSQRQHTPHQHHDESLLQYMETVFSNSGIALKDWVVIGRGGLYCPRSLLNESDPWPYSATAW